MAEIKRPHYFTGQFLQQRDFNDEQAYHLGMRRRLTRGLHTPGVAEGFELSYVDTTHVQVGPGVAIDKDGREIVLEEPQIYELDSIGRPNRLAILTIEYQEEKVEYQNENVAEEYKRTAERAVLMDRTEQPPGDGSVIQLGTILLSSTGYIESSGSIVAANRLLAGARLAPESVEEAHLADRAVTIRTLAHEARPWTVQGTDGITVTPNDVQRTVTVGETHSARTDNPHATTAHQIDSHDGGTNRIVTQINAGSGIIERSRVETSMVTGVVRFTNLRGSPQSSPEIDPGLGAGPVCVQLAVEEGDLTIAGDYDNERPLSYVTKVNRTSGRFRIFVSRTPGSTHGEARVRWCAFKPTLGTDSDASVNITVSPSFVNMAGAAPRRFTANVQHTSNLGINWDITNESGTVLTTAGVVTPQTGTETTYISPGVSGTYYVRATSADDPTRSGRAQVVVTAALTVNISQTRVDELVTGGTMQLSANVINAGNTGINWSVQQGSAGGTVSSTAGESITYTAPTTPGTYTVIAKSVADGTKQATCSITVLAPTISVQPDRTTLAAGGSTTLRATITPASAHQGVNWTKTGPGTLTPSAQGLTATYTAPSSTSGATVTIKATRVADSTQFRAVTLTVNGTGGGSDPDPDPLPPGGGKFTLAVDPSENATPPPGPMPPQDTALAAAPASELDAKARTFVRPHQRPRGRKTLKRDA